MTPWSLRNIVVFLTLATVGACGERAPDPGDQPPPVSHVPDREGRAVDDPGPNFPVTLVDDEGREVIVPSPPLRLLSLVPSATEMLRDMGLQDRLVGRTDFDRDPALDHLPSVGGGLEPSVERVVSLEPDLVIRFAAESDRATPAHLDGAGIRHLAVRPDRIQDIRRTAELLGAAAGRTRRADSLVRVMDRELEEVARSVEGAPPLQVVFLLGGDPPWVAGPDTFLDELMGIAGGQNAFHDLERSYSSVSVEEVIRREPDLILAPPDARIPPALEGLASRRLPGEIQSPGHRVGASARALARILHPDRLP